MFFKSNITISAILISAIVLVLGCEGESAMENTKVNFSSIRDVPQERWDNLAQKKIYFGHKSVGFNIIDGIKDIIRKNPQIKLNIIEIDNFVDFHAPVFAHSKIGKNFDPASKIDAFENIMGKGIGNNFDFAFFKFCYVDVHSQTDIERVLEDYKKTMSRLKAKYPETTFIHFTVPLTSEPSGIKALIKKAKDLIKKIMGKTILFDNIKRNQYNKMLIQEYGEKEPLFDLAKAESIHADGKKKLFTYTLLPEYTDDGGHLNEYGRKLVAEQLLIYLAQLKSEK